MHHKEKPSNRERVPGTHVTLPTASEPAGPWHGELSCTAPSCLIWREAGSVQEASNLLTTDVSRVSCEGLSSPGIVQLPER